MPAYNGNQYYVVIDGVNVSAYVLKAGMKATGSTEKVTRGNATHEQRAPGLRDSTFELTLSMDDTTISSYIQKLVPLASYNIEFGPQGNGTGRPRNVQKFILTGSPFEVVVDKKHVAFDLSYDAADAPTVDMFAGATF